MVGFKVLLTSLLLVLASAVTFRTQEPKESSWKKLDEHRFVRSIPEKCGFIHVCEPGTVCAGKVWKRRCVKPMPIGGTCGTEPYWVCSPGVECISNVCSKIVKQGDTCSNKKGLLCEAGTTCDGICTKSVKLGEMCSVKQGLVCEAGTTCKGICTKTVKLGEKCSAKQGLVCEAGASCNGICFKLVGYRQKCSLPSVVCEPNKGLACVGRAGRTNCMKLMELGGSCKDPWWVCKEGLTCSSDKICKQVVGYRQKCSLPNTVCEPNKGLACVGRAGRTNCMKLMELGGSCKDPWWVCKDGLTCSASKICTQVVGYRQKCSLPNVVCEPNKGLGCVGPPGRTNCMKLMDEGGSCIDPWWACKKGLTCVPEGRKKICRRSH